MQCDETETHEEEEKLDNLSSLDAALRELGMLSSSTNSRLEFMKELSKNPLSGSLKINTKFVSNVSMGLKMKPVAPHARFKPYVHNRPRIRTKSENSNDHNELVNIQQHEIADCMCSLDSEGMKQLKKAKSLESIVKESGVNVEFSVPNFENLPELEIVNDCIQNLKVVE